MRRCGHWNRRPAGAERASPDPERVPAKARLGRVIHAMNADLRFEMKTGKRACCPTAENRETWTGIIPPQSWELPKSRGCYVIVLRLRQRAGISVGRFGVLSFEPGYYCYVGSAFGPGGLRARLGRHIKGAARQRWHVDYLRAASEPIQLWFQTQSESREHAWAEALGTGSVFRGIPKFGTSDCRCHTHLFHSPDPPRSRTLKRRLGPRVAGDGHIQSLNLASA